MKKTELPKPRLPHDDGVDFAALYDGHLEYAQRRANGTFAHELITLEVRKFKIPNLISVLPAGWTPRSVVEIGCATGELIATFPVEAGGSRLGIDISGENIAAARARFPDVAFVEGDFSEMDLIQHDCVILSDVLEHIEDDSGFLRAASGLGKFLLINLPLEDNWLNRNRNYGPADASGHLRKYSLSEGLTLIESAGLKVLKSKQVWIHESSVDAERRSLRAKYQGHEYAGSFLVRSGKSAFQLVCQVAAPLGRRVFASNLFALAGSAI